MKLSIIIPVYNEQGTIAEVIERIRQVELGPIAKEIIICDDGSWDDSPQVIRAQSAAANGLIQVHTSPVNLGKGAAVRLGFHYATGDILIIQDADLELDPAAFRQIIGPIVAGKVDVVYGSRFLAPGNRIPTATRLANRFLTALTNLLFGARLTDMETAYKAFRREAIASLRLRCVGFDFEPEITARLLQAGYRIHETPVAYRPRTVAAGKKLAWVDGIDAIYALVRCRLVK